MVFGFEEIGYLATNIIYEIGVKFYRTKMRLKTFFKTNAIFVGPIWGKKMTNRFTAELVFRKWESFEEIALNILEKIRFSNTFNFFRQSHKN